MSMPLPGESSLPIPRATRTWPKAQPKMPVSYGAPPAFASAVAAVAKAVPATSPAPAAAAPKAVAPPPPPPAPAAPAREATSVAAAFATWKQATAVKTSSAGQAEPAAPAAPPARREDPVMYVYRAAAKQARGEHEAAIADLTKAIELDPLCTTAWAGRGMSCEALGDLAGAKRDYSKSIEIELKQEIARQARTIS